MDAVAMLILQHRSSTFKSFTYGTFITLCLIFFTYQMRSLKKWKGTTATSGTTTLSPAETLLPPAIPEKIWYKTGPKGLSNQSQEWINACLEKNPSYQSEILTDSLADVYVKENFAFRPDIVNTFLELPVPILKADLLRYLILFAEGGIWSDLDVSCGDIPIHDWIPAQYKNNTSIVVGLEFDLGLGESYVRQFASWTVMAKPKSPHMLMVIDQILEAVRKTTDDHQVMISDLTLDIIGDVVDFTGPRRLTRGVVKSLELSLNETIDAKSYSNILEPKLISDVLILPGYSFAASTNTFEKNENRPALVTHHYAGSWKNKQGGELV